MNNQIKERPILFNGEMVRAILDGRKTMTRRVVKSNPAWQTATSLIDAGTHEPVLNKDVVSYAKAEHENYLTLKSERIKAGLYISLTAMQKEAENSDAYEDYQTGCQESPFGLVGDHLYVRESFQRHPATYDINYVADGLIGKEVNGKFKAYKTSPSIHMNREETRITLEITAIRIERLNDISDDDAIAEGIECEYCIVDARYEGGSHREIFANRYFFNGGNNEGYESAVDAFYELWKSVYGVESLVANPWVWCISFKRVD